MCKTNKNKHRQDYMWLNKLELRYPLQSSQTQICCSVLDLSYKSHLSLSLVSRRRDWYSGYSAKGQCNPDSLSGIKEVAVIVKILLQRKSKHSLFFSEGPAPGLQRLEPLSRPGLLFLRPVSARGSDGGRTSSAWILPGLVSLPHCHERGEERG